MTLAGRNHTLGILVLACATLFGAGCRSAASDEQSTPERPPNIIFILADDLGWADLPAYGNTFHETPNLDRLAANGMRFTDAYAAAPVCSPTRAAIQSGLYPARLGITSHIPGHWRPYEQILGPINRTQYLPPDVDTIAERLKDGGYTTGYFGKWHLGEPDSSYLPNAQGYDSMLVSRGGHFDVEKRLIPKRDVPDDAYLADVLTDHSVSFMEANRDKPFFLFLGHYLVHIPLQAKEPTIEKYRKKEKPADGVNNPTYAAMIEHLDAGVGRVLESLDRLGLDENTLVVFYSDNGGLYERYDGSDGIAVTSNAPLRDEKGSMYEGGIRVPLIVRWPGVVEAGSVSNEVVTSTDFYPTLLEIAGIDAGAEQVLDGRSILSAFKQRELEERPIYWHYPHYHHDVPSGGIREGAYKLIEFYDDGHVELYNLEADIGEQVNLADEQPERARRMQQQLASWRAEIGADMPVANREFDPERRGEWTRIPSSP